MCFRRNNGRWCMLTKERNAKECDAMEAQFIFGSRAPEKNIGTGQKNHPSTTCVFDK